LLLGLGSSGPQVSEGWHGVRFAKQLQRTREYVAVVRMALAHQKVEFHGETLELPLPDGPGKVLKLTIRPVQERIPIYLAVLGPKNVALAGEIADGWLPVFFSPEHTATLRAPLEEGAAKAGRSLEDFRICPTVNVMISDDAEVARNAMRPVLGLYVGGMGSREQNFYNRMVSSYGFEREAQQVQELYLAGRKSEAMLALPDDLIDAVTIAGPRQRAKERIKAFRDAGVETLIVAPMSMDNDERKEQLHIVADLTKEIG
jgi:F420-dependent oxidoreductase-like protein